MEASGSYHSIESNHAGAVCCNKNITTRCICYLVAIVVLLVAIVVIISILSGLPIASETKYCTTVACLQLAADLSQSINESVDPCDDFYHYVCDGFDKENRWNNVKYPEYGVFAELFAQEKEAFLDELFYNTKLDINEHSSLQKASAYFKTCYNSNIDVETTAQSQFIAQLINKTTFASSNTWDLNQHDAFHTVLQYLTRIDFNTLFTLQPQNTMVPAFTQFMDLWQNFDSFNASNIIHNTFVPLYETLFDLDANESQKVSQEVLDFAWKISNISTVSTKEYQSPDSIQQMLRKAPFNNLSLILGDSTAMNYTRLVYDVYFNGNASMAPGLNSFGYLSGGVSYFEQLGPLIERESPFTVQYFIWTSILYYYLDFEGTFSQTRYEDRSDFCVQRTITQFPFVYGYVLEKALYDDHTQHIAFKLASAIKTDGLQTLIQNAEWLDNRSRKEAVKKAEQMELYIGYPPKLKHVDQVDMYYHDVQQSMHVPWVDNVEQLTQFKFKQLNDTFWGNSDGLTDGWPDAFSYPQVYDSWLTNINAFYWAEENWFTIPVSISQRPFLDSDAQYPSALMFGALGVITGHEMSHAFDPDGSQYNYNGTFVGSIFTNYSQKQYEDKMQCFDEQYDGIMIDDISGRNVYDNGTRTITENVADNAGIWSSWTAWRKYLSEMGNDQLLYGVELNQEQLFFVGYARVWCESARADAFQNYSDVHSEDYARVIGPLQNIPHFANAFQCKAGSRMNPEQKCTVW
eukprot:123216_1